MAVGVDFLSKTKLGGMKDIMGAGAAKTGATQAQPNRASLFQDIKSQKTQKPKEDIANMDSSSLLKYVYENGYDNNKINLPSNVEFNGQSYPTNGAKFDDVVKDICKQTGETKFSVENELKKKYITANGAGGKGTSLNMQA